MEIFSFRKNRVFQQFSKLPNLLENPPGNITQNSTYYPAVIVYMLSESRRKYMLRIHMLT